MGFIFGDGQDCIYNQDPATNRPFATPQSGADTRMGQPVPMKLMDTTGVQLVMDPYVTDLILSASDSVVAVSGTWTFSGYTFDAQDVGGTVTIAGATHSGNNGTFTILTRVSAHVVTTATTGLVDETFSSSVTAEVSINTLVGSWAIELSNDYTPGGADASQSFLGQTPTDGHWTDITADFTSPAIVAVTSTASTRNQYCLANCRARAFRYTFVSTAGRGFPLVLGSSKSWS